MLSLAAGAGQDLAWHELEYDEDSLAHCNSADFAKQMAHQRTTPKLKTSAGYEHFCPADVKDASFSLESMT